MWITFLLLFASLGKLLAGASLPFRLSLLHLKNTSDPFLPPIPDNKKGAEAPLMF
jgi:hypothetical protein